MVVCVQAGANAAAAVQREELGYCRKLRSGAQDGNNPQQQQQRRAQPAGRGGPTRVQLAYASLVLAGDQGGGGGGFDDEGGVAGGGLSAEEQGQLER